MNWKPGNWLDRVNVYPSAHYCASKSDSSLIDDALCGWHCGTELKVLIEEAIGGVANLDAQSEI
jgi:hypothetical protein